MTRVFLVRLLIVDGSHSAEVLRRIADDLDRLGQELRADVNGPRPVVGCQSEHPIICTKVRRAPE